MPRRWFLIAFAPILLPAQTPTFHAGVTLVKADVAVTAALI